MVRGSVPFDDAELKAVKSAGESALYMQLDHAEQQISG